MPESERPASPAPAEEGLAPGAPAPAGGPQHPAYSPQGMSLLQHLGQTLRWIFLPQPGEPLPVLGGRLAIGVLLLGGIALVSPQGMNAWLDRRIHPAPAKRVEVWEAGKEASVQLTLITADSRRLNCAHDQVLAGQHCGFGANKRSWPRQPGDLLDDNDHDVIQPYRTADTNALVLVSGIWAQPELALRVHREPPTYYDIKKQVRFVAYCRVRFVGELTDAALRWESGGKWLTEPKAMVAQALSCTLEPPQG